jgi:hypothetical protein
LFLEVGNILVVGTGVLQQLRAVSIDRFDIFQTCSKLLPPFFCLGPEVVFSPDAIRP